MALKKNALKTVIGFFSGLILLFFIKSYYFVIICIIQLIFYIILYSIIDKVIFKMSKNITESVLGRFKHQSAKSIKIELKNGNCIWVPKSLITNLDQFDHSNTEDFQMFEIMRWLILKRELDYEI